MVNGKLIVIEGIDGSGKTTQTNLLSQYLAKKGIANEVINFPRYDDNLYGKLIRRYLEGEFGSSKQADPRLMSLAYAGDRALAKSLIENWLNSGKIVLANRYNPSNKAHMSANLPANQREEFMRWLDELEFETNKIPRPNLNILLDVEPKAGQQNVKSERGLARASNEKDIHENDLQHLENAYEIYLELAKAEENWKVIECMDNGNMKSIEAIHKLIVENIDLYLLRSG